MRKSIKKKIEELSIATCPVCDCIVYTTKTGYLASHNYKGKECPGSGLKP